MTPRRIRTLLAAGLLAVASAALAQQPATHLGEETVYAIAARLRCVVCQNLSVADSPSEMAQQMRATIRERLVAGESPEQIVRYFVDRYGEWILLEPRRSGFTLLVWLLPPLGLLVGLGITAGLLRKWTRRRPAPRPEAGDLDPAMRDRIRRELDAES